MQMLQAVVHWIAQSNKTPACVCRNWEWLRSVTCDSDMATWTSFHTTSSSLCSWTQLDVGKWVFLQNQRGLFPLQPFCACLDRLPTAVIKGGEYCNTTSCFNVCMQSVTVMRFSVKLAFNLNGNFFSSQGCFWKTNFGHMKACKNRVKLSFTVGLLCYMLAVNAAQTQQLDGSLKLEIPLANVQITAQK